MNETTSLYRGSPGKIFLQYAAPQALALLARGAIGSVGVGGDGGRGSGV